MARGGDATPHQREGGARGGWVLGALLGPALACAGGGARPSAPTGEARAAAPAAPREATRPEAARAASEAAAGAADGDGDGIPDAEDRCPDQAETVDGVDDADGCPERPSGAIICQRVVHPLRFGPGSPGQAEETAARILDEVAAVLRDHPEVALEVVGHADPREGRSEGERVARSVARAEWARRELVARGGFDPARLTARGAGGREPVDPGVTPAGRANNRRVEFVASSP